MDLKIKNKTKEIIVSTFQCVLDFGGNCFMSIWHEIEIESTENPAVLEVMSEDNEVF